MRMLVTAKFPHEPFNTMTRKGEVGKVINKIMEELKPETVYFTEIKGHRTAMMIVDVADPTKVPMIGEPWFLIFNADVSYHVVMKPDDLQKANLDALGKKWG